MGQKMKNAPVYFVLAQVRFNTLLTLETYVPVIQDTFRKAGYADFAKTVMATINLNLGVPASANQMPVGQTIRYLFMSETKSSGFTLDQMTLTFQTAEYDTFDPFLNAFLVGLKTIYDSVGGLNFSERIGIRFLDAVCPRSNEKITDYLAPSLMGLFEKLNDRKLRHILSETFSTLNNTNLMCRTSIQDQAVKGIAFPPDLQPVTTGGRKIQGDFGLVWCY